jgi:hypothetical protein
MCGEQHALVFTTRTGRLVEPRSINQALDVRSVLYGVRCVTLHDTRCTCGSLLAALDVHPRIAMAILRQSRIALTMEIYTQVPGKATRDALRRLSDWLEHDQDQGDKAPPKNAVAVSVAVIRCCHASPDSLESVRPGGSQRGSRGEKVHGSGWGLAATAATA